MMSLLAHAWPMRAHAVDDSMLPDVITAEVAVAAGLTRDQIRQRVRSGRWTRVARGAYVRTEQLEQVPNAFGRAAHVHRAAALAAAERHPGSLIAFHSAVQVHGLSTWGRLPSVVSLIVPDGHWTGTRGGVNFRALRLSDEDRSPGSIPVTSVARSWCDVARTAPMSMSLAVGDSAMRSGALTVAAAQACVRAARGLPGVGRAERALVHLSGLRETPLESASWAYFIRHGLPLPRMQVVIVDDGGNFIARVDFLWDEFGVVGECDGRIKYTDRDALYGEKRREDGIRQRGYDVVRWGSSDLANDKFARRLRLHLR